MPTITAFLSPWVWLALVIAFFSGTIAERIHVSGQIATLHAEIGSWSEKYQTAVKRSTDLALLWAKGVGEQGKQTAAAVSSGAQTFQGLTAASRRDSRGASVRLPADAFGLLDDAIAATNKRANPTPGPLDNGPTAAGSADSQDKEVELTELRTWGIQVLGILDSAQTKLTGCINTYNDLREKQSEQTADTHDGDWRAGGDLPDSEVGPQAQGQLAALVAAHRGAFGSSPESDGSFGGSNDSDK